MATNVDETGGLVGVGNSSPPPQLGVVVVVVVVVGSKVKDNRDDVGGVPVVQDVAVG